MNVVLGNIIAVIIKVALSAGGVFFLFWLYEKFSRRKENLPIEHSQVHPLLRDLYKDAAPKACQKTGTCKQFLKCGRSGLCSNPCKECLVWTGCGMSKSKIRECRKHIEQKRETV